LPERALATEVPSTPLMARWRLRRGQLVRHRQWDDEFVVFNDLSGDCHLLDEGGFAILGCLQSAGKDVSVAVLAQQLAEQFDDIDPADPALIEETLAGLAKSDLIEQVL
jgi:PqqD family protein of HPr-rel-A system